MSFTITSILQVLKLVLAGTNNKPIIDVKINASRGLPEAKSIFQAKMVGAQGT